MRNSNTMPLTKRPRHKQKILSIDTLMAVLKEFISTFIFVFTATGSRITINKLTGDEAALGLLATAIAHAFALSVAVYTALYIGAARKITVNPPGPPRYTFRNPFDNPYTLCGHINPAVTFGAFIGGNLHIFRGLIYWIVQLLASICACLLLMFIFGRKNVPVFDLSNGVRVQNAIVLEMVMTFGLVFTMCATVFDPKGKGYNKPINIVINGQNVQRLVHMRPLNKFAPLAIGLIVGANILVGGPFDGASMNPALSFGPAVVTWRWSNHWVYWVGPLIGGGLASFFYDFVFITK